MRTFNQMLPLIVFLLAAFTGFTQPFGVFLTLLGAAAIVFAMTNSYLYVAGVFAIGLVAKMCQAPRFVGVPATGYPAGAPIEPFQVKDAASVQERLEGVHTKAPLQPKVAAVTGVLESPSILDNVPLQPMQELASEALPGASIPASAKARVLIYPPAEGFVPAPNGSQERGPKENPYLHNGPDQEGVDTSLFEKGTDMTVEQPAANLAAAQAGSAVAF
jgi:hypothetical protein